MKSKNKSKAKARVVTSKNLYNLGSQGGFRAEVRQKAKRSRYLYINRWWDGQNQHLVINQEKHWRKLKRLVDKDFAKLLGWSGHEIGPIDIDKYVSRKEYENILREKEREIKQKAREMRELQKDIRRAIRNTEKRTIERFKTKIPIFRKELKEFEQLLVTSKRERELHTYLREHPWMFSPIYINAKSEQQLGFRSRSDFALERVDGFFDIIELKKSTDKIFARGHLSSVTKKAISQMIRYLHKCDTHYFGHRSDFHMDILKPEGKIIIGRTLDKEMERDLRIHNAYFNNIRILTYDQLVNIAKQSIRKFEIPH